MKVMKVFVWLTMELVRMDEITTWINLKRKLESYLNSCTLMSFFLSKIIVYISCDKIFKTKNNINKYLNKPQHWFSVYETKRTSLLFEYMLCRQYVNSKKILQWECWYVIHNVILFETIHNLSGENPQYTRIREDIF